MRSLLLQGGGVIGVSASVILEVDRSTMKGMRCSPMSRDPSQINVFVYLPGLGEAMLPALQRPRVLSTRLCADPSAALQSSFSSNVTRDFTGWC